MKNLFGRGTRDNALSAGLAVSILSNYSDVLGRRRPSTPSTRCFVSPVIGRLLAGWLPGLFSGLPAANAFGLSRLCLFPHQLCKRCFAKK